MATNPLQANKQFDGELRQILGIPDGDIVALPVRKTYETVDSAAEKLAEAIIGKTANYSDNYWIDGYPGGHWVSLPPYWKTWEFGLRKQDPRFYEIDTIYALAGRILASR